jgi:hypothetical protein
MLDSVVISEMRPQENIPQDSFQRGNTTLAQAMILLACGGGVKDKCDRSQRLHCFEGSRSKTRHRSSVSNA